MKRKGGGIREEDGGMWGENIGHGGVRMRGEEDGW